MSPGVFIFLQYLIFYYPNTNNSFYRYFVIQLTSNIPEIISCPKDHPHAYYDGKYCCKFSKEKVDVVLGDKCDGGNISLQSMCCNYDEYIQCPNTQTCQSNEGNLYNDILYKY